MENNQFPQREEDDLLPQELTFTPPDPENTPDIPPADVLSPEEGPASGGSLPDEELPPFMDRIPDTNQDYPPETAELSDLPPELPLPEEELEELAELSEDPVALSEGQEVPEPAMEDEDADEAPPESSPGPRQRPVRKGRPKRRKGEGLFGIPSILITVVWLALILFIGVTLGRMVWVCAADLLAFGQEDKVVTVTIYEADTMEDITNKLYDAGLIRYKSLFNFYASISDAKEDIDPGIYDLNTRYDYHALVNMMSTGSTRSVVTVTIPEGYTCRQIFDLLQDNKVCTSVDLAAYAASGELDEYWFLENVERGSEYCLEGFLFPDTYEFYKNDSPRAILQKMLNNFEYRFTEEMRAQLDSLNTNVTGGSYSIRELVIVASLIEKETAAPSESPRIAGVIYNRLFRWGDTPAFLNIDASIVYAQNGDNSRIDTSIDSPYNTYRNTGLTPTPIANPGLASLKAALNPESHNYFYYVLNPSSGMHQFSSTYEEHQGYVNQFAAVSSQELEDE